MDMTFKVVSVIKATIDDDKFEKEAEETFGPEDIHVNDISITHILINVGGETHDITASVLENVGEDTLMTMFQKVIGRN